MRRVAERLRPRLRALLYEWVVENFAFKLMALFFAMSIWAFIQTEQVVEARVRAPVQYRWPENLLRVEEVPQSVSVTLSGPQGLVRTIGRRDLRILVDLSEAEAGQLSLDLRERTIEGLPDGLTVVQISPAVTELTLDKVMRRTVKVRPSVIGEPGEGWQVVSTRVEPPEIELEGPESLVRNIAEVWTAPVDVAGLATTKGYTVPLAIKEKTVTSKASRSVKVTVRAERVMAERAIDAVPVLVRTPGWRVVEPAARVIFAGPTADLAGLDPAGINLLVSLPEGTVPGPLEIPWTPGEARIKLSHNGPGERISVKSVEPVLLHLEPISP